MKEHLEKIWSHLENISVVDADSQSLRRRKISLVVIAIFTCLTGILIGMRYYIISGISNAVLLPGIYVIIVGTALVVFLITKRLALLLYPFLFMILCIPVLFHWSDGGFSGQTGIGIIFWAVLAPFGALMFQSIKDAVRWFLFFLLLIIVSLVLDKHLVQFNVDAPYEEIVISHGLNLILLSITIFITMLYFVNAFQNEQARSEKLVIKLHKSNDELESAMNELKATQTKLIQSEKMASMGRLVAGVAHEINTPIGAMCSMHNTLVRAMDKLRSSMDEMKFGQPDKQKELSRLFKIIEDSNNVITSGAERVTNIVQRLRSFARLDEAEVKKVNVHEGIEDTLALLHHELKKRIEIERNFGNIPSIPCFPSQLNQVFLNLLVNAAQAIDDKGVITITTFVADDQVRIQFTDTGKGIPKEDLDKIFDPGYTTKGVGVGTGLGLSICYQIIQRHHGKIMVESEIGKGTTFTIELPTNLKEILNET
jgi:signal transduction histidine kinase